MPRAGLPILFINMRTYRVQYAEAQWLSRRATVACTRMLLCILVVYERLPAEGAPVAVVTAQRTRTRTCGMVEPKPAPSIPHYNANRLEACCAAASSYSIGHLFRYLNIVRCIRVVSAYAANCSRPQPESDQQRTICSQNAMKTERSPDMKRREKFVETKANM